MTAAAAVTYDRMRHTPQLGVMLAAASGVFSRVDLLQRALVCGDAGGLVLNSSRE